MALWMAVSADELELPIAVEDSRNMLAKRLGVKPQTISRYLWRQKNGEGQRRKYRIVVVKEE